jgi:hypothetical protein
VLGGAPAPLPSGTAQATGASGEESEPVAASVLPGSLTLSEGPGGVLVLEVTGIPHVGGAGRGGQETGSNREAQKTN